MNLSNAVEMSQSLFLDDISGFVPYWLSAAGICLW